MDSFQVLFRLNVYKKLISFSKKDPTDCTKYHVCNGSSHSIVECPVNHRFWFDPAIKEPIQTVRGPPNNTGNGEFSCQFTSEYELCYCWKFCDEFNQKNTFSFKQYDRFHYAYCLEIGTLKQVIMFKCPNGTAHNSKVSITNTVECTPFTVVP